MDRDIIAKHIEDSNGVELDAFNNGEIGSYVIVGLDFSNVKDYNFADGNSYMFVGCTIDNKTLSFSADNVVFEDCVFNGTVDIKNTHLNSDNETFENIDIIGCRSGESLINMKVTTSILNLVGNDFDVKKRLTLVGTETAVCPLFVEDTGEIDRENNIKCGREFKIDSIDSTMKSAKIEAPKITIPEYDSLYMRGCILDGVTKVVKRPKTKPQIIEVVEYIGQTISIKKMKDPCVRTGMRCIPHIIDSKVNGMWIGIELPKPKESVEVSEDTDIKER